MSQSVKRRFPFNALALSLFLPFSGQAAYLADGDTNQSDSNDADVVIIDDILVGETAAGTPSQPSGSLTVNGGTRVSVTSDYLRAGIGAGTAGIIIVDGAGSALSHDGYMYLGESGYGQLDITNGGTVNLTSSVFSYLARQASASALINVSGAGSALNAQGAMAIGQAGQAVVNVTDGASMTAGQLQLGYDAGGKGTLNVTDGGQLTTTAALRIGADGDGEMNVLNGGQVTAADVTIGTFATSTGSLTLDGNGTHWQSAGSAMSVGARGNGTLTVSGGAALDAQSLILAANAGSTGVLNIGGATGEAPRVAGTLTTPGGIAFGAGNGVINFNHTTADYVLDAPISGQGTVNVLSGSTTLTGANSYTGITTIDGGELKAGNAGAFSMGSDYAVGSGGTLSLNGFNQTLASLDNAGTVSLAGNTPGTVLTVTGNYTGNNGLMIFNSVLADDDSLTDRLVVEGDTAGTTRVQVNNLGGSGANTLNGIELISVGGASDGEFVEGGRIVAGAFDYHLARGEGANAGNWYLSNEKDDGSGEGPGEGGDEGSGEGEGPGGGEDSGNGSGVEHVLRPEGAAYAANLAAARQMFDVRQAGRQGETFYTDAITGQQSLTSLWMVNTGTHTRSHDDSGQLKTQENRYVVMLGADLARGTAGDGSSWRAGVMAGTGSSQSNSRSALTGYQAKGSVQGYSTGLYGSWFGDGTDKSGPYLATQLQYSWFVNRVNGEDVAGEKYRANGLQAALEAGWVSRLSQGERLSWFVQPQARVAWSGIAADDHREANGTLVQSRGEDNISTLLGVRLFGEGHAQQDDGKSREFLPFMEANWLHNSADAGVSMDGVVVSQTGARNAGELRLGVEGKIHPQLNVTGSVGQQIGDVGYSSTSAALGLKYSF